MMINFMLFLLKSIEDSALEHIPGFWKLVLDVEEPTRVDLDIPGHLLHIIDPKGRNVLDSEINMIGNALHTASPEAGERWMFCDVSGSQAFSWDSKMN